MPKQKDAKILVNNKIVKRHVYSIDDDTSKVIQVSKRYYYVHKAIPEIGTDYVQGQQLTSMEANIFWEAYEGSNV